MNKTEMEKMIIKEIESLGYDGYSGYAYIEGIKRAICRVMFGWDYTDTVMKALGKVTPDVLNKINKVYTGMVNQGYLKVSKSGKMAKLIKEV